MTSRSVSLAFGVSYWALARCINATVIRIREGTLRVRAEPLPWTGSSEVEAAQVRRVWLSRREDVESSVTWHVNLDVGDTVEHIRGLSTEREAVYLAWALRHALGLPG
ncbi:MAG: hypothetical protein AB8I08_29580 [Sandaracinaceae bacterium]